MPKFLLLRFSSIGDIVLTTPVIRCLKQQVPDAEVHFATKKIFAPILQHNPYIDKLWLTDNAPSDLAGELKAERFDEVIDLHHNRRTFFLKRMLGVKSYSFRKLNIEKWLLVNWGIDRLPALHIVDRYLETVAHLGVKNDGKGLDHFISTADDQVVQELPLSHQSNYIAFVIGAKHATKQLPVSKIISIIQQLNRPVVLIGGKEDHATGEVITAACPGTALNCCGKFDINRSAALLRHASKVITHDTGMMHIAAAFQKEIVSVWGNTVPQFGMYPYLGDRSNTLPDDHIVEVNGLRCRPCSKIGFNKCPKGHFHCMTQIDEEKIVRLVRAAAPKKG